MIGLGTYEFKAYRGLCMFGEATASQVSATSEVPHGRIYDILASLEHKGLALVSGGNPKRYAPTSPERLDEFIRKQQEELKEFEEDVKQLKGLYASRNAVPVEMAQGKSNFHRLVSERSEPQEFSYSIKLNSDFLPAWVRKARQRLKRGVKLMELARVTEHTAENVQKWNRILPVRAFENDGVAIGITEHDVLIGLVNSNTTLLIRDEAFIDVMRRLFEAAYASASSVAETRRQHD